MLHFLGFILLVIGGVMLVPVPAAVMFNEGYLIPYFVIPAAIALVAGLLLRRRFPRVELRLGTAMVLVTVAWILISLFSCVPYMFGNRMSFVDSYFESMSGFTATGLTMIAPEGPPPVPSTILFWRSLTQWVGGLGVIVLFLAAPIGAGRAARKMYAAEARAERIEPSILETVRSLWKIYVLFTLLGIIGLFFVGMPLFESINHSMTGIATGGFTVRNDSFARYGAHILPIAIIIMLMGATSFAIHRKVMAGQWREFFRSPEVRLIFVLIALATIIIVWDVGLRHAIFQSTSAVTGTGFSTAELAGWSDLSKGVLTGLMIVGGGYGSTSSAIKLIRTVIIIKAVYWTIKRSFLPERAVVPMKIAGRTYTEREIMETSIYAFIYVVVLLAGTIVLMMLGNTFVNSMFESASAQGNVGLSVGITSVAMPLAGKIMFIIQMLIGRLEILPVIALMSYFIAKTPRRRGIF